MFIAENHDIKPSEAKIWLSSPTMHPESRMYMDEAFDTNWVSTVGKNIQECEAIAAQKAGVKCAVALSACTAALHLCVKLAGERLYGKPNIGHGAVEGRRVFCSDMTFDATLNPVVYELSLIHILSPYLVRTMRRKHSGIIMRWNDPMPQRLFHWILMLRRSRLLHYNAIR